MKKETTTKTYDRTLRTAHTLEQIKDAEEEINKITTAQELFKATNGPDRFLQTKYPTATQVLYAQIAEQNKFLTRQLAATEAAVKQLEDTTRATRRLAEELRTRQAGIHQTINRELDKIKNIVRPTDHCSYTCRTCGRIAPGHTTGTRWCPNFASTSKEEDTSEPEYFDANEYDDWFGEEGEHNLAT